MNNFFIGGMLGIAVLFITSCTVRKQIDTKETMDSLISVRGVVSHIEDGGDGYMATLLDDKGQKFVVTISIVNLQKSGSNFQRFVIGEQMSVIGKYVMKNEGKTYVMATQLLGDKTLKQVSGKVTKVENGKDGYTATIEANDGSLYQATISMNNLQKSGSLYKRYEVGDSISLSGPFWESDGIKYITVYVLQ